MMITEDFKAIFSRHADTPDPIDASVLQKAAPVLQVVADPSRPTPQTPVLHRPGGGERYRGKGGVEKLEGQEHCYSSKHYRVWTLW